MSVIKKHKAAFFNFIGAEMIGIGCILAVAECIEEKIRNGLSGLLMFIGAVIMAVATIAWVISRAVRKKENTNDYIRELCINYMEKTSFGAMYWIIIILTIPIWPVVLVYLFDVFTAGAIVITAGISSFMSVIRKDVFENSFYVVKNGSKYFDTAAGDDSQLIDSLYEDCVFMHTTEDLSRKENFICSLLKREGTLGKSVKAYRVTNAFLSEKYNHEFNSYFKEFILVPFSQFDINAKNGKKLFSYFRMLSLSDFANYIDAGCGQKESTKPEDYMHTEKDIMLRPYGASITNILRTENDIFVALDNACECDNEDVLYKNCLMVLKNVSLSSSFDNAEAFIEKTNRDFISAFKCDYNERTMEITICRDADVEEADLDDEECEELITISLSGSYEEIQWYWDSVRDISKTQEILKKING